MNIINKNIKKIGLFCLILTSLQSFSQQTASDCTQQFAANQYQNDVKYFEETLKCVPFFGENNSASLGDKADLLGLLAGEALGPWAPIIGGLDAADSFWDCVGEAEDGYNEVMTMLGDTWSDCMEASGADYF